MCLSLLFVLGSSPHTFVFFFLFVKLEQTHTFIFIFSAFFKLQPSHAFALSSLISSSCSCPNMYLFLLFLQAAASHPTQPLSFSNFFKLHSHTASFFSNFSKQPCHTAFWCCRGRGMIYLFTTFNFFSSKFTVFIVYLI